MKNTNKSNAHINKNIIQINSTEYSEYPKHIQQRITNEM